jgi:hypothetical protein
VGPSADTGGDSNSGEAASRGVAQSPVRAMPSGGSSRVPATNPQERLPTRDPAQSHEAEGSFANAHATIDMASVSESPIIGATRRRDHHFAVARTESAVESRARGARVGRVGNALRRDLAPLS